MSYVPPHLRVSDGRSKSSPEAPPPSLRGPNLHASRTDRRLVPDVTIIKSDSYVTRLIVLSCHPVEFIKFDGDTFAHLQHRQLYVLKAATADVDNANSGQANFEMSLQEKPSRLIIRALHEDLEQVLEKFKGFVCTDNVGMMVPLLWLKFGKVIFHSRSGQLKWHKSCMPEEVEMMSGGASDLSKTFDNAISKETYSLLHKLAHRNIEQTFSKERYVIQVSDETRPDTHLWCVCVHSKSDEQMGTSSNSSAKSALTMIKVRLSPIRYMICDVACIGRSNDLRLMFFVKKYLTDLSEDELLDLESCFTKVSLVDSVKGGLHWPFGSKQSRSGRFKVVGSLHEEKTVVIGGGLRWSLRKGNRVEFKASSGRISYEVGVRPVVYDKFCKAQEEKTVQELMSSITDVIDQVWEECIGSELNHIP